MLRWQTGRRQYSALKIDTSYPAAIHCTSSNSCQLYAEARLWVPPALLLYCVVVAQLVALCKSKGLWA